MGSSVRLHSSRPGFAGSEGRKGCVHSRHCTKGAGMGMQQGEQGTGAVCKRQEQGVRGRRRLAASRPACSPEGGVVAGHAAHAAHVAVHLHRLGGVDVLRLHKPARLVGAGGDGGEVKGTQPLANLGKDGGVARVAGKPKAPGRRAAGRRGQGQRQVEGGGEAGADGWAGGKVRGQRGWRRGEQQPAWQRLAPALRAVHCKSVRRRALTAAPPAPPSRPTARPCGSRGSSCSSAGQGSAPPCRPGGRAGDKAGDKAGGRGQGAGQGSSEVESQPSRSAHTQRGDATPAPLGSPSFCCFLRAASGGSTSSAAQWNQSGGAPVHARAVLTSALPPHLTLLLGCAASCHQSSSTTLLTPRSVNQLFRPSGTYLQHGRGANPAACFGRRVPWRRQRRGAMRGEGCEEWGQRQQEQCAATPHQRRRPPNRLFSCFTLPLSRWSAAGRAHTAAGRQREGQQRARGSREGLLLSKRPPSPTPEDLPAGRHPPSSSRQQRKPHTPRNQQQGDPAEAAGCSPGPHRSGCVRAARRRSWEIRVVEREGGRHHAPRPHKLHRAAPLAEHGVGEEGEALQLHQQRAVPHPRRLHRVACGQEACGGWRVGGQTLAKRG